MTVQETSRSMCVQAGRKVAGRTTPNAPILTRWKSLPCAQASRCMSYSSPSGDYEPMPRRFGLSVNAPDAGCIDHRKREKLLPFHCVFRNIFFLRSGPLRQRLRKGPARSGYFSMSDSRSLIRAASDFSSTSLFFSSRRLFDRKVSRAPL